jgi:asparagine synthase (glutamine-hydrolysing)
MTAAMSHRGPDDQGVMCIQAGDRQVALGSTRLAILDLSRAGHMPMQDPATGNWIVYNGEVYNFPELRRQLESQGETFSSRTDTEVILKGYARWGESLLDRLQGMFAFAIWNGARQELFLARDRLGEKPLYYHAGPAGEFLFASEVRALLASGRIDRRLEEGAAEVFLCNGFLASPLTAVRGVRSLLPASWMRVSLDGRILETAHYWRPGADRPPAGEQDREAWLQEALEEAVRRRLVSDVPIGTFLSGGLDSSIIVALAASAGPRLRTFSVTFDEAAFDESRYSAWVAKRFGTEHTEVRLRRQDFETWLPGAVDAMDQPSFDGINTYCVSRAAKAAGLTVALSGLGADESFGGYPYFKTVPWVHRCARLAAGVPAGMRELTVERFGCRGLRVSAPWKLAEIWNHPPGCAQTHASAMLAAYQATQLLFPWWVRRRLLAGLNGRGNGKAAGLPEEFLGFVQSEAESGRPDNLLSLLALRLFLGERCLRDTDAMSMAVSLEVRTAFTDHRFLDAAWSVPAARRCEGAPHKPYLRRLFQQRIGEDFPSRKKQGFLLPLKSWLQTGAVHEWMRSVLSDRARLSGIGLDPGAVSDILSAYQRGRPHIPWSRVWALHVFARWCEKNRVSL